MTSALSPREIQSRLRAGASVAEVAADAGVDVERISGFALPVMAERSHVTRTALAASVRRRGDGSGHRRLGDLIHERLLARGLDADTVEWDSWRQSDLRWRLVGLLEDPAASRAAEFVYDSKGRFSVADNADARWMIGEELPGVVDDPDNENTIDFHDEFALVRATADGASSGTTPTGRPGDDVPHTDAPYEASAHTSELDELYDMLNSVSEDSVRIYLGLEESDDEHSTQTVTDEPGDDSPDALPLSGTSEDAAAATSVSTSEDAAGNPQVSNETPGPHAKPADTAASAVASPDAVEMPKKRLTESDAGHGELRLKSEDGGAGTDAPAAAGAQDGDAAVDAPVASQEPAPAPATPEQDALVPEAPSSPPKRKPARKRASIPSWDEIMFGGPTPS